MNSLTAQMRIWKVSHGLTVISDKEHGECLDLRVVTVHGETAAKGRSSITQGAAFTDPEREGDIFYLCRANQSIELLGVFVGDAQIDKEGWATRKYKELAKGIKKGPCSLGTWWAPGNNSTFTEVPVQEFSTFEKDILGPFFGLSLEELTKRAVKYKYTPMTQSIRRLLLANQQLILTGAPGTGKTYMAREIAAALIEDSSQDLDKNPRFKFVQFHPSYDYTDFVEGLKPALDVKVDKSQIWFEVRDGTFMAFCKLAMKQDGPCVFVIDEINRADLSRVFGELFYALEPGYRGPKHAVSTQYASLRGSSERKDFYVPENVYIIGTMNDIDRSVESIDFALRRRFAWYELKADEDQFERVMGNVEIDQDLKEKARQRYHSLNEAIAMAQGQGLGRSYQIGPAYYRKLELYKGNDKIWSSLWELHLEPLIREYVRGMPGAEEQVQNFRRAYDLITINPNQTPVES